MLPDKRPRHYSDDLSASMTIMTVTTLSSSDSSLPTFTTTTVTQQSTTFTSVVSRSPSPYPLSISPTPSTAPNGSTLSAQSADICPGHGIDAAAAGILASIILPTVIGLILWLIFAIVRPRFRQIYALREWFVPSDFRPTPLGSGFFAWLFPKVPLVPSVPEDVSNAGRSPARDAELFPSDEQLSQRTLWVALMIALGWSILALGAALPLYLINTPCNDDLTTAYGGSHSTLSQLSLLRLLRLFDSGAISSDNLSTPTRRALDLTSDPYRVRIRIIILTILSIVLGILPVLIKILRQFNTLAAYRQRWIEVKCEGRDLAWLSARKAPSYAGWGERQLKDYLVKIGLSSSMGETTKRNRNDGGVKLRQGQRRVRRREDEQLLTADNTDRPEVDVDVECLFSIGNTHRVALLIHERDEILENLEIAETRYIKSFRVTTPDPSILDFVPPPPPIDPKKPYISRPLPLATQRRRTRSRRHLNRAYGSSSLAPTSFVAPSSYYKLRGVQGINGGRFADSSSRVDRHPSLSESISSRVVGTKFMEVNHSSAAYSHLPLGSHVAVEKDGQLGPVANQEYWMSSIPDPRLHGPNYSMTEYDDDPINEHGVVHTIPEQEEWVDLSTEDPDELQADSKSFPQDQAGPSSFRRRPRPPKADRPSSTRRETFPLRNESEYPDDLTPPHLRLQPSQPFVRPLDGLGFEDLGQVYAEITHWRSRLKAINNDIADAQRDCYTDIANGTSINGWLMVGRGLRFIPGSEIIEGRAKEDIRWDVLQNERSWLDKLVMWSVILVVLVGLAFVLIPAIGLSLASAPDVAHYLPFLAPVLSANPVAAGLATIFAPAVAVTLFIIIGLAIIHWVANIHGSVSISGNQLFVFKITFFVLTAVATVWLIAIGAILFSMRALSTRTGSARSVANGTIYMAILALALIFNIAIIVPACLLLQPLRLWRVIHAERQAVTPRQRFRAIYPRTYNPSFAIGACVLAILFASTFALIFPLIAPAVVILLLLSLIAHRFLVGYVYARTHSQTGGLLQLWLLKRFGTLISFHPILLGLILLSRQFWIEGSILIASGVIVIVIVEVYTHVRTRLPGRSSLNPNTQNALERFKHGTFQQNYSEPESINVDNSMVGLGRGSMASVLEMMSLTLAVTPSSKCRVAVPLSTESLDDLTATERAARTHPDAPPRLPPLPFADHAEEIAGILYAPELVAPPPIIWLPNDSAGVAQSEAVDLQKYHNLQATLDVHSRDDVPGQSSEGSQRRTQTPSS